MKKLICYFILISSLCCGVGMASSRSKKTEFSKDVLQEFANSDPRQTMIEIFEDGLKNNNYRDKAHIKATPLVIKKAYPEDKNAQRIAVDTLGECLRQQEINGKKKYTDKDVYIFVTYSKQLLGLK